MRKQVQTKPWLKTDGSFKSEASIKESCKSWSPAEWEEYLESIEGKQIENAL